MQASWIVTGCYTQPACCTGVSLAARLKDGAMLKMQCYIQWLLATYLSSLAVAH